MPVVKVEHEVSQEFIDDTLCTALDVGYGGSLYWIRNLAATDEPGMEYPFESISRGGVIRITTVDGDSRLLTLDRYLNGFALWAKFPHGRAPEQIEDDPADATEADNILQLALFGEVIYG